jgi:hypothetical protein
MTTNTPLKFSEVALSVAEAFDLVSYLHELALDTDEAGEISEQPEGGDEILSLGVTGAISQFWFHKSIAEYIADTEMYFERLPEGHKLNYVLEADDSLDPEDEGIIKTRTLSSSRAGLYLMYPESSACYGPLGKESHEYYDLDVSSVIATAELME